MWMDYPGGNIRFASYNSTCNKALCSDVSKGYVLPLTYFGNVANISALEFLPVSTGSITIELVRPQCLEAPLTKWCTLTKKCEKNCVTDFESKTKKFDDLGEFIDFYTCENKEEYCSAEETCSKQLKCPTSITKGFDVSHPSGYEVVKELFSGQATAGKKIIEVNSVKKAVNEEDVTDKNLPYAGYKTHVEEAYPGDLFLAFRCEAGSVALCARLPYE